MLRGSVISYDWYKSAEGQGVLAQLTDPTTGYRKLFGLLEQPSLPPSIPLQQFKLFLVGRTGSGKTCLVSWLAGLPGWNCTTGESPGVRVTQVYWPCLVTQPRPATANLVTFKLQLCDGQECKRRCERKDGGSRRKRETVSSTSVTAQFDIIPCSHKQQIAKTSRILSTIN